MDLTLITCSFNTPEVTEMMLKSFVEMHPDSLPQKILVMENSTKEDTQKILKQNNIPFNKNRGMTHSLAMDKALKMCKTKYALTVDTDIIFMQSVKPLFDKFKEMNGHAMGQIMGSRGGYNLKSRIVPWLMFVDIEALNENQISYHDEQRISESKGFFGNIPIQANEGKTYYDVGSTFLEDLTNKKMTVLNIESNIEKMFVMHYEGMSWQTKSGHLGFQKWGMQIKQNYMGDNYKRLKNISIKNKFF